MGTVRPGSGEVRPVRAGTFRPEKVCQSRPRRSRTFTVGTAGALPGARSPPRRPVTSQESPPRARGRGVGRAPASSPTAGRSSERRGRRPKLLKTSIACRPPHRTTPRAHRGGPPAAVPETQRRRDTLLVVQPRCRDKRAGGEQAPSALPSAPSSPLPSAPAGDFKGVTAGRAKATGTFKQISKRAFLPHQLMWGLCPAPF